ncbi:MAG: HD domain-containing protein [Gemmataceae bacterium]
MNTTWPKLFRDPVHNLIPFEDTPCDHLLLDLINTREVQRLRRIKQMGTTELVFPGANHSRFAHSLGVLHTARLFLEQLERASGQLLPGEQRAFLLAAALLHDVGHGPFSHAFELITGLPHEGFTHAIIQDETTEVHRCLRAFDREMPGRLALFFDEDAEEGQRTGGLPAYLTQVVSGQLDADRCDYLLRDSHATGTNYGDFDLAWMLAQLRPDVAGNRFYLTRKGLSAVETYLFARFHMYRTVYFHKTSRAAEVMLKLLFRRLKELIVAHGRLDGVPNSILEAFSGQIALTRYLDLDDHTITELLKICTLSHDATLQRLGDGLLNRRLYKAIDMTGMVAHLEPARFVALNEEVTRRLESRGLDPRYHFIEDSASDTPYEPYRPDAEKPLRQIWVESGAGRVVEVSQLSEALMQLQRRYTVIRYYVPADLRAEVLQIAEAVLKPGRRGLG